MEDKRANIAVDVTVILIVLVSLIVAFPIIYSNVSPIILSFSSSAGYSEEATSGLAVFNDKLPRMLDNIFLITLLLFWVGGILLALFVDSHPIFFVISLLLVVIVLWTAVFLGDFVDKFMNTDAVSLARDNMPIITFVSSHILEFMIAISFSMLLALFGKTSRGGGF